MKVINAYLFGAWAWFVFVIVVLGMILCFPFTSKVRTTRLIAKKGVRLILKVLRYKIIVKGYENLIKSPSILVVNHASYIDPIVLSAVLPPQYAYVGKRELKHVPFLGYIVRKVGTHLVDRFNAVKGAQDIRRIMSSGQGLDSIIFFPEGTFYAEDGLGKFKLGAFLTAVKNDIPVIPIAMNGTRQLLRSEIWLPSKVPLKITIFPPIYPDEVENGAQGISEKSRSLMLSEINEPDLKEKSYP